MVPHKLTQFSSHTINLIRNPSVVFTDRTNNSSVTPSCSKPGPFLEVYHLGIQYVTCPNISITSNRSLTILFRMELLSSDWLGRIPSPSSTRCDHDQPLYAPRPTYYVY